MAIEAARLAHRGLFRPVIFGLTVLGLLINRLAPDVLQRAHLDIIDRPLRFVPPLPGTEITPASLPNCPAKWVVAPAARDSKHTAIAVRDAGLPVAAGQVLLSPLTSSDMGLKYRALERHRDVMFPFVTVKFLYDVFATKNGERPPPVMPPESDLRGLGPFLLQVGTHELLLNDAFALATNSAPTTCPRGCRCGTRLCTCSS